MTANAKFVQTTSEQVIGLYEERSIDPVTTATIDLTIAFPKEYSTLCLVKADCSRCSKNDAGCDTFIKEEVVSLANVSNLTCEFK